MSGSSTGMSRTCELPSPLQRAAENGAAKNGAAHIWPAAVGLAVTGGEPISRLVLSTYLLVPASPTTGSGYGVRSSQMPPSAVAAIRYRSSSSAASPGQDCADT
jgi:hypothetical protein